MAAKRRWPRLGVGDRTKRGSLRRAGDGSAGRSPRQARSSALTTLDLLIRSQTRCPLRYTSASREISDQTGARPLGWYIFKALFTA